MLRTRPINAKARFVLLWFGKVCSEIRAANSEQKGEAMASRLITLRLIRPGRKPAVVNTGRSR
jgi:hypothetical protein